MLTLVNISGGNLHLESLGKYLAHGDRLSFELKLHELLSKAPEIALYLSRGRAFIDESSSLTVETAHEN